MMVDSARWSKGVYEAVENEDPNSFHLLVDKSFGKKDVAETINVFEAMVLHVKYPLDLLRVISKVIIQENQLIIKMLGYIESPLNFLFRLLCIVCF